MKTRKNEKITMADVYNRMNLIDEVGKKQKF